jgi:hypothetical protein
MLRDKEEIKGQRTYRSNSNEIVSCPFISPMIKTRCSGDSQEAVIDAVGVGVLARNRP